MQKIAITKVQEGAIAARDIYDIQNRIVISAGTALSAQYLKKLERWGVNEIFIEQPDTTPRKGTALFPTAKVLPQKVVDLLDRQFRKHRGSPLMMHIKEAAKQYFYKPQRFTDGD